MAIPAVLNSQRDFSAGELDTQAKRRDDLPIAKAGARQMANWRVLNSGVIEQRSGRRAFFPQTGRVDEVTIPPGLLFYLCFGADGSLLIRNTAGKTVAQKGGFAWTKVTVDRVVWTTVKIDILTTDIVITFPDSAISIARWNGSAWSFPAFSFATDSAGSPLAPFFRLAAPGATLVLDTAGAPGATVALTFSAEVLNVKHPGALFRFANARIQILTVGGSNSGTAKVLDQIPPCQKITVANASGFQVGTAVEGSISSAVGEVVQVDLGSNFVYVQVTNFVSGFVATDKVVGPSASSQASAVATVAPQPIVTWDEQVLSDARGWPQSCFSDRGRLGFCNLPQLQECIIWSAVGSPYNMSVGIGLDTDAIVKLIAGRPRVYHVGAWYDEIVFTDEGLYYIPIGITNPLSPAAVNFLRISNEAASNVRPAFTTEGFLYVNAGLNRINAVIGTGAAYSTRPYIVQDVTEYHTHLFAGHPKAIAVATGDGTFPERYVYVINQDGTMAVGRYEAGKDLTVGTVSQRWVGWLPITGQGVPNWVSALHSSVVYTTAYGGGSICEIEDSTVFMDAVGPVNPDASSPMVPPVGHGVMWWFPGSTVVLMNGLQPLGEHATDSFGNILPIINGEDFSSKTLVAGFSFQPIFEPFIPNAEPGQDMKQRTRRRRTPRMAVTVENSTGFLFQTLYSGPAGVNLPVPGSVIESRRVPAYNAGDNQALPPPAREETQTYRPTGRSYDPRIAIVKDTVGPIRLIEVATEATT